MTAKKRTRKKAPLRTGVQQCTGAESDPSPPTDAHEAPDEPSQSVKILRLVLGSGAELWHDADQVAYATTREGDEVRHMPLRGRACKTWIARMYYEQSRSAPNRNAMSDALCVLEGKALHEGREYQSHVRIAGDDTEIWIDMCDGRVIRVNADGWAVLPSLECPHRFTRRPGMLALPEPRRPGRLRELWEIVNCPEEARPLVLSWLVCAFRPGRPYPILPVEGEQGSAKSTFCRVLRLLVDPREVALRRPPRNDQELAIACRNGWIVALDNISHIPDWLSDALCGVATGGGFEARTLFTDDDQTSIAMLRPVLLNGITNIVRRPDLLDRSMLVRLPAIPDDKRMPEDSLKRTIDLSTPYILAALLDAVSTAIRRLPEVRAVRRPLPRMADACLWTMAAAPALGLTDDDVYSAIIGARDEQATQAIEDDTVGSAVLRLASRGPFEGTATDLLEELNGIVGEGTTKQKGWPGGARGLSSAIRRLVPGLRRSGVTVEMGDRRREAGSVKRLIRIARTAKQPSQPSQPSHRHEDPPGDPSRCDGREIQPSHFASQPNGELWGGSCPSDGRDGRDAESATSARVPSDNPGADLIAQMTARALAGVEDEA